MLQKFCLSLCLIDFVWFAATVFMFTKEWWLNFVSISPLFMRNCPHKSPMALVANLIFQINNFLELNPPLKGLIECDLTHKFQEPLFYQQWAVVNQVCDFLVTEHQFCQQSTTKQAREGLNLNGVMIKKELMMIIFVKELTSPPHSASSSLCERMKNGDFFYFTPLL